MGREVILVEVLRENQMTIIVIVVFIVIVVLNCIDLVS